MKALHIRNWDKHYENNRSRDLKRPEWLPLPNKFDGRGFMELLDHAEGMAHYGAWCLLLGVASRMPTRGLFVADSGRPLSIKDIARITRGSVKAFEGAVPRLIEVGWMEEVDTDALPWGKANPAGGCGEGAGIPQGGAGLVRLKGREGEEEGGGEVAAPAPKDGLRGWLEMHGLKVTGPGGADLVPEWKAAVKGLRQEVSERILSEAKPGIQWPSEFKAHRAQRAI